MPAHAYLKMHSKDHLTGNDAIRSTLEYLETFLPAQVHIKDFVHQNILYCFQHMHFHEAVCEARKFYGSSCYLPIKEYKSYVDQNAITKEGLQRALDFSELHLNKETFFSSLNHSMGISQGSVDVFVLRKIRTQKSFLDVDTFVKPGMIRLSSHFFDQGVASFGMPFQKKSFWECVKYLEHNSWLPLFPWTRRGYRALFEGSPGDALRKALERLVGREDLYGGYLWELLMVLPGWAGLVREAEKNPHVLPDKRIITLESWLAVMAWMELGYLEHKLGSDYVPLMHYVDETPHYAALPKKEPFLSLCHEALEWSVYEQLLGRIKGSITQNRHSHTVDTQVVCCIDDRNFSFRHFLEKEFSSLETYAGPGFFGIDFLVADMHVNTIEKQCPVMVSPQTLLIRKPLPKQHTLSKAALQTAPTSALWHAVTHAIPFGVKLLGDTFFPQWSQKHKVTLEVDQEVWIWADEYTHLTLPGKVPDTLKCGFSVEEAAHKVLAFLKLIGLTKNFASLVAIVAHSASSVNNPYFAAYDCGACSGRPGVLNAKVFCVMVNDPRVRTVMQSKGVCIPEGTWFAPFVHDTTADMIYPLVDASDARMKNISASFDHALDHNAKFRCEKFDNVKQDLTPKDARRHVYRRSIAWHEPRSEYDHATNFACVIGRRKLTVGFQSSRNIFLHSYDPEADASADVLSSILSAIVPVCGGINLGYLFSRMDPKVHGAGSKLPQNITGLLGMMTGFESDLRTGLPFQMVDIHDPIRLMIVVDQSTQLIETALNKLCALKSWITGEWVRMVSSHPDTYAQCLYQPKGEGAGLWTTLS